MIKGLSIVSWSTFSQPPAGAHSALTSSRLVIECDTCSAAVYLIYSVINRPGSIEFVWAVGGHIDGSINFDETFSSYVNGIVRVNNLRHYNIHCFC